MQYLNQYVPSEVCLECDGCCRFKQEQSVWRPRVLAQEKGLAEHIFAKEALDDKRQVKALRCHDGTYQCKFFSPEGNACTIYAYRPFECQLYPFVLMKQAGEIILAVHLSCPHIQETNDSAGFDKYVAYLKGFFQQEDLKRLLRSNISLIDEYAAYQDELQEIFSVSI